MNTDEYSAVQRQPKPISPRRRWSVRKNRGAGVSPAGEPRQLPLRQQSLPAGSRPYIFFSRPKRTRRSSLGAHASSVLSVSNSPHAGCVRSQENAQKSFACWKEFSADRKLFVILRVLPVFVVDWVRSLPRRREDAKNRQVFGCGSAALCSSVVSFCGFYAPTHCKGAGIFTRGMGKREVSPCSCKMNLMD